MGGAGVGVSGLVCLGRGLCRRRGCFLVLWVFLTKVEGDGGGCIACKLGYGCVEFGEDVCSV